MFSAHKIKRQLALLFVAASLTLSVVGVQPATALVNNPRPGKWRGSIPRFYVTPSSTKVNKFTVWIDVSSCGITHKAITYASRVPISGGKFSFSGAFHASGQFGRRTKAAGNVGLSNYPISGCGNVSSATVTWGATWRDYSQPDVLAIDEVFSLDNPWGVSDAPSVLKAELVTP